MMKKNNIYFLILLVIILSLLFYFYHLILQYDSILLRNNTDSSDKEIAAIELFFDNASKYNNHFIFVIIVIPIAIGLYMLTKILKKHKNNEIYINSNLKNYSIFVRQIDNLCAYFLNRKDIFMIEIREENSMIIIAQEIKDILLEQIYSNSILSINNILTDIVRAKFNKNISIHFENNKIQLLKK